MRCVWAMIVLATLLSACGQKGPLTLPQSTFAAAGLQGRQAR